MVKYFKILICYTVCLFQKDTYKSLCAQGTWNLEHKTFVHHLFEHRLNSHGM